MRGNWQVARERKRKREDLVQSTHELLLGIRSWVSSGRLTDEKKIALAPFKKDDPGSYQGFDFVLYRLQQLNTVHMHGVTLDIVTEPDTQQRPFLEHLGVKSLLPRTRGLQTHCDLQLCQRA